MGATSGWAVTPGAATVAHWLAAVSKHPEAYSVIDTVSVNAGSSVGGAIRAASCLPGSMEGPPGKQLAKSGYSLR